jgi:hypothetical protein
MCQSVISVRVSAKTPFWIILSILSFVMTLCSNKTQIWANPNDRLTH